MPWINRLRTWLTALAETLVEIATVIFVLAVLAMVALVVLATRH